MKSEIDESNIYVIKSVIKAKNLIKYVTKFKAVMKSDIEVEIEM